MKSLTLAEIAKEIGGEVTGSPETLVSCVAMLADADAGSIVYLADSAKLPIAEASKAAALLVPASIKIANKPIVRVGNTKLAFAKLLRMFFPQPSWKPGVHPSAVIDASAVIGKDSSIGPYVVIGANVRIGERVKIAAFAFVGEKALIGDDAEIQTRVTISHGVEIGRRCVLYEGCVIGSQGFGYATDEKGKHHHVPQVGTVILEDDVEVGANTTIDRATLGATRIRKGTKIDNLVQIGHNCDLGENCFIAALTGLAGSAILGAGVMIGGQVGIRDHVKIGERAVVAGASGVWGDLDAGSLVSGNPARDHRDQTKMYALMRKLPEIVKRLEALEKQ